jgi:hypothetical protein
MALEQLQANTFVAVVYSYPYPRVNIYVSLVSGGIFTLIHFSGVFIK